MRTILLIALCLIVAGCPEVVRGPRVVHYNPDWFYVRHMPWIDGDDEIAQLALDECLLAGRGPARLDESLQINPADLRYAVWRCQPDESPVADDGGAPAATP